MTYMAIDQYGTTYHNLGKHPRKALLERLGASKAEKLYVDTADGRTLHVGYIVRGLWLALYKVSRFEKEG